MSSSSSAYKCKGLIEYSPFTLARCELLSCELFVGDEVVDDEAEDAEAQADADDDADA